MNTVSKLNCYTSWILVFIVQLLDPVSTKIILCAKSTLTRLFLVCDCNKVPCLRTIRENALNYGNELVILVVGEGRFTAFAMSLLRRIVCIKQRQICVSHDAEIYEINLVLTKVGV